MKASLPNSNDETFEIVELGGGRGTNAKTILKYERQFGTSPTSHELQIDT
jgi:SAM-dependent MidA family methyltransferase